MLLIRCASFNSHSAQIQFETQRC